MTVVKVPVAMAINGLFSALMMSVSPAAMPISHNALRDLMTNAFNNHVTAL